ncbi:MAG: hypothetical protein HOM11_12545 [Methylococcales bacterium]|jgi:predicted metal-dependent peptidase|nr:hypothetical protein [Methylococcales bacterium]MBT7444114.1 hypothetical protein [Methylococcales bacterium]
MSNLTAAEKKLSAARTKLVLDKPFIGALVLRLPLVKANPSWCDTTATDAKKFYYNENYIDALSVHQVQFVLGHEALHCALSHFSRRHHRNKRRWDVACDYAINPMLIQDGLTPPPGALHSYNFENMTADEIYPCIDENTSDAPMDQHIYEQSDSEQSSPPPPKDSETEEKPDRQDNQNGDSEKDPDQEQSDSNIGDSGDKDNTKNEAEIDESSGGAPQPPPLTSAEQEQLEVQWQQRLAGAAQQAIQAGKMGGGLARLVEHLLQPRLPWRMLLAKYMTATARDDYSYTRPARRESNAILPSLRSAHINTVVAVDTSGSISKAEILEFLAEVNAIKGQMRAKVTLLACDTQLAEGSPWVYEAWEEITLPEEIKGGGGTNFNPVFNWVDDQGITPDLLLFFTDANGKFPELEPAYPVLWLVKGKHTTPFGQRVQLN